MHGKLTQPKIDGYISWLRRNDHFGMTSCIYDDKSQKLLDELFELLEQVAPESPNGVRTLWLRAERGPIEDFGNAAEEIEEGNYDSEEEFIDAWKSWFPEDVKWYHFQAVEDKAEGYRAVAVRHSYVIVQDKRREPAGWPCEISEFVQWLVDGVRSCIEMLKAGTYNDVVRENLPPQHRTGTIRRRDFWNVWPDARVDFFKDISPADVAEFIERASAQEENYAAMKDRLQAMTANDFFRFCAMGYAENTYNGCGKTPKEQYVLHADGRDEGLQDIDADSPEAFHAWFHDRDRCGGHPWEVCRGGNSTHVDLRVMEDMRGYFLYLAGAAWNRTMETVKFYLALTRANIPVYLAEAKMLADRLAEEEMVTVSRAEYERLQQEKARNAKLEAKNAKLEEQHARLEAKLATREQEQAQVITSLTLQNEWLLEQLKLSKKEAVRPFFGAGGADGHGAAEFYLQRSGSLCLWNQSRR